MSCLSSPQPKKNTTAHSLLVKISLTHRRERVRLARVRRDLACLQLLRVRLAPLEVVDGAGQPGAGRRGEEGEQRDGGGEESAEGEHFWFCFYFLRGKGVKRLFCLSFVVFGIVSASVSCTMRVKEREEERERERKRKKRRPKKRG